MFVDQAKIWIASGHGGSGCVSFRREKYMPKGGPDGGDGGDGGSVIFICDPHMRSLYDFTRRKHIRAQRGEHGKGANKSGKNGRDVEIKVPAGTQLYSDETGELIGEITTDQDRLVVAKGGKGGRGNARFATATHQAPREWEQGQLGHEMHILLELKLIADVGLVGLPNAGKSTLLSRLSNARPKVADYPFTTLQPNLGVVHYKDAGAFVIADIPGLIEGAHEGKGLGLEFLRHIERTKVLVFLVDMASETPWQDFQTLNSELESHDLSLLQKPRIVCLNKIDAVDQNSHAAVMREFESIAVHQLSAVTGDGVERVLDTIWRALQAESK
ncbi:GTPase ObgE [candidate division KSB1 bacterium]|nr:GTPase ObgE [candidate division KSB1 bacterium]